MPTSDDQLSLVRAALALPGEDSSDFDLNPGIAAPEGRALRSAGVLMALAEGSQGLDVYLTKRANHLKHHPGQIAFPGGKQEPGDGSAVAAALREAEEEIALPRDAVEVLGTLPPHETVTSFTVTPVVGRVIRPFDPRPEIGEVEEVFRVPLSFLMDAANYRIEGRRWQGRRRHYFAVPYGPYYIWGATARMLRGLADRMARCG
ncbi:CoA pyrophosphatase [Wenxinia marina]|uniref:NTP pyrophosphohydrolase n=1 Tax=Wenxinia marina DSM 24838 TaxID=1123501 RepID=A0A0D0NS25_9RHOB|nr:CoA pyrophosphatase [Wenxinia marina]KIQ71035.1 NTP pyrophosphohydrolase [Wenxinia marina DSM 24838]GGL55394.1 coenzyme A pyrophosphatase [Wenxinia marina]